MSLDPVKGLSQANAPGPSRDAHKDLRAAAAEFESLFINQMLKSMRETVAKSELFHGGNAEEIYSSMLDTELSKSMAKAGGIGLADMLLRQFTGEPAPVEAPIATRPRAMEKTAAEPVAAPVEALPAAEEDEKQGFAFPLRESKRISSGFGDRKDPFTGKERFHHGMDISAEKGTPVYPAAPGTVVFSGRKGGYGNMVEVLHDDGLVTRYGHNAENLVKEGDRVSSGEPIAKVGSTGRSTGPHLHFEVLREGKAVDPEGLYA